MTHLQGKAVLLGHLYIIHPNLVQSEKILLILLHMKLSLTKRSALEHTTYVFWVPLY
jgi:hypothetical protein